MHAGTSARLPGYRRSFATSSDRSFQRDLQAAQNFATLPVRPYTHDDHCRQMYFDADAAVVRVSQRAGWPAPTPTPTQIERLVQG